MLLRHTNQSRIRATVNILRLHFFQTLCLLRRNMRRIISPPSWTIHHTSTLPSKRSVLLGKESMFLATISACWPLDTHWTVSREGRQDDDEHQKPLKMLGVINDITFAFTTQTDNINSIWAGRPAKPTPVIHSTSRGYKGQTVAEKKKGTKVGHENP